jgi:bifunctional non-homologous end joining protein LigD
MVLSTALPLIEPTLATLAREPFHRTGWVYEEKYDGWRMLAYKDGATVRLVSRTGRDHTRRFANLASALARLGPAQLILDGEVCVFDENLLSQFHLLGEENRDVAVSPGASGVPGRRRGSRGPDQ